MINNYVTSAIRTVVPIIVGWLLSLAVAKPVLDAAGVDTPTATRVLTGAITGVLAALWYLAARALESKFPKLGVLLGVPAKPTYPTAAVPVIPAASIGPDTVTTDTPAEPVVAESHIIPPVTQ